MFPISDITNNFGNLMSSSSNLLIPAKVDNGNRQAKQKKQAATTHDKLSAELWLRILGNLDRNELDACEHVCLTWKALIRTNTKRLPGRDIDYVIISSKRVFSLIISSGQLIKVYKMDKYLNTIPKSINDVQQMRVQTFRRPQRREEWPLAKTQPNLVMPPDPSKGPPPTFQQFLNELIVFHKPSCVYNAQGRPAEHTNGDQPEYDAIGLPCPNHLIEYSRHEMPIPPTVFFNKLDTLLRDHRSVRFFAFQSFTLSSEFIAKFAHVVRPIVSIEKVVLLGFRSEALSSRQDLFFKGLLAEKKSGEQSDG